MTLDPKAGAPIPGDALGESAGEGALPADQPAAVTDPDGRFLRSLFLGLIALTVAVAGLDLWNLFDAAKQGRLGGAATRPSFNAPTSPETDRIQRYLPHAAPVLPNGGKVSLPGWDGPAGADGLGRRMTFRLGTDGRASAMGRIEIGSAGEFDQFLAQHGRRVKTLFLHSPGGSVSDALQMARSIRQRGLTTEVPANGYCASSCPLAFSGGAKRRAGRGAVIGVHQVFTETDAVGTLQEGMMHGQLVSAQCQSLLGDMGVAAELWVHAMSTSHNQLYVLTPEELVTYKLATEVDKAG